MGLVVVSCQLVLYSREAATQKFKEVCEAYEILGDTDKKVCMILHLRLYPLIGYED